MSEKPSLHIVLIKTKDTLSYMHKVFYSIKLRVWGD